VPPPVALHPVAAPAAPPKPVAPPPNAMAELIASAAGSGPFRVQVAATKDDVSAQHEWLRLQQAHPDLLGGLQPTLIKADLGDRGIFYRILAGPVADKAAADKLCGQLKAVSIGCIVVRP
jgi:cell division septation protein DedD